jgi:hypothetical protein
MPDVKASALVTDTINAPEMNVPMNVSAGDVKVKGTSVGDSIRGIDNDLQEHIDNTDIHLTPEMHSKTTSILSRFAFPDNDIPVAVTVTPPPLPRDSIPWVSITELFSRICQDDTPKAPGNVFVTRVPYGVITTNSNNQTTISYPWSELSQGGSVYSGLEVKLMDNVLPNGNPRQHAGSTDTVEGVDDYVGKEWAFWWGHCNYTYDEFGQKHITAFEDVAYPNHKFSQDKQTGAFGPKFWFFVKPEKYQYTDGNGNKRWTTHEGTEEGQPFTQLWGISDTRWSELSDVKRVELMAHGITAADFHIWPECLVWDKVQQAWVERPYWIHSAYCGGWGYDDITGEPTLVSKKNAVLRRNISYRTLNAIYGAASGGFYPGIGRGGAACVNGFGMLMDVIKNGTKYTQPSNVHTGMSSNQNNMYSAYSTTSAPGYIFPVAAAGTNITNFQKNATVYLVSNTGWNTSDIPVTDRSITMQVGRVIDIRDETFTTKTAAIEQEDETYLPGEEVEVTARCIILDPATVQPFNVCMTAEDAAALNNEGVYASCRIINGFGMGGITDNVIGKHDGQCYATDSAQHTYRVQGTEYMPGAWICAADTVAIVGDGTAIEIDGIPYTPGTDYKVVLQCDSLKKRKQNYNAVNDAVKVQDWLDAGYIPAGLVPNVAESYVANVTLSSSGTLFPVLQGKLVQSDPMGSGNGTGDFFYNDASPAYAWEFISSGPLNNGSASGSAYLNLGFGLGYSAGNFSARD